MAAYIEGDDDNFWELATSYMDLFTPRCTISSEEAVFCFHRFIDNPGTGVVTRYRLPIPHTSTHWCHVSTGQMPFLPPK